MNTKNISEYRLPVSQLVAGIIFVIISIIGSISIQSLFIEYGWLATIMKYGGINQSSLIAYIVVQVYLLIKLIFGLICIIKYIRKKVMHPRIFIAMLLLDISTIFYFALPGGSDSDILNFFSSFGMQILYIILQIGADFVTYGNVVIYKGKVKQ